ncbi:MAG: insulinase family protein [Clostridia bacterium]|nr:insulinase family protein [Clostridia bacterium]
MLKKSTNRIIALVLTSLLTFNVLPLAKEAPKSQIPVQNIGETVYGFKLEKKLNYNGTEVCYFIHEKSGAHAVVEKNSNKEKSFEIGFRTPAENDKGINHIIEHSVLNGSEKYPYKNMISELHNLSKTSTYLNAYTGSTCTCYPVSNLSENELETLAKIYTDGIFKPNFLTNEKIFKKEGIRYELNENGNLTANGTVFNEMNDEKANIMPQLLKRIFPNTSSKNYYGGIPDQIMDLKYEEICETYKKYYHPSNCLIYLGGDINYERFFKWLDKDYLSTYDAKNMSYIKYEYQNSDNLSSYEIIDVYSSDCSNSLVEIDYFLPWDFYNDNYFTLKNLVNTINSDTEISKHVKEKGYKNLYGNFTSFFITPTLSFMFEAPTKDKKLFEQEFSNGTLKEILSMINSSKIINNQEKNRKKYEFSEEMKKAFENTSDITIGCKDFMESFVRFNDPVSNKFFDINKNNIAYKSSNKTMQDLVKDIYNLKPITTFLNFSSNTSLSMAKKIKNKCKYLENEKEELTKNYKEQQNWANVPNNTSDINKLKSMFTDYNDVSIPENIPEFDKNKILNKDCYYCPEEKLGDFFQIKYAFKVNYLNDEDKKYLPFLNNYLEVIKKENLDHISKINLYNKEILTNTDDNLKNEYELLTVTTKTQNLAQITEQLNKILSFKNPLDTDSIKDLAQDFIDEYKSSYGIKILKLNAVKKHSVDLKEAEEILENQYNFCQEIINNINSESYAQNFSKKLNNLSGKIFNVNSLQNVGILSSLKNKKTCQDTAYSFINSLNKELIPDNSPREFKKLNKSIAVIDKKFANNQLFGILSCPELCQNSRFSCLLDSIRVFFNFNIREKGGAYATNIYTTNNGYIEMLSKWDPNVDSTIEFFNSVPKFLQNHNFKKEDIENMYTKKLISICNRNKLSFVNEKMRGLMLFGDECPDYQKFLEESLEAVKTMNTEDIKSIGKTLEKYIPEMKIIACVNSLKNVKTKFDIVIS